MFDERPVSARRPPGFRFSAADAFAIIVAAAATILLWGALRATALLVPIVLGHFFLFCNVFRVRRRYELWWAGFFVLNVSAWWLLAGLDWWPVLATQTPVTLGCIAMEVRSPAYHGVGYTRVRRSEVS